MIISVETATRANDYDWYAESGRLCTTRPRTVISENTASFAFYAERINGVWSATMFNLWIPEKKDVNGRRIRLSVRFDELDSETQARALALAYLALPLKKISSIKSARYSAELAECYGVAEDGLPVLQFDKMKQWAESAIARAVLAIPGTPVSSACYAEVDKSSMTEIEEIRRHLQTYALRDQDGMRILFDDGYVMGLEKDVDIIITIGDTDTKIEYPPFAQKASEKNTSSKLDKARGFARNLLKDVQPSELPKKIVEYDLTKKWVAGCVILGILLVISILTWLTTSKALKFQGNNESRKHQVTNSQELKIQAPTSTSDSSLPTAPEEPVEKLPR